MRRDIRFNHRLLVALALEERNNRDQMVLPGRRKNDDILGLVWRSARHAAHGNFQHYNPHLDPRMSSCVVGGALLSNGTMSFIVGARQVVAKLGLCEEAKTAVL